MFKYRTIDVWKERYPIAVMCRFFGVSRSGYYGYVRRKEYPAKDASLAERIAQCQQECHYTYGYRRACIWLERNHGVHHNPKTILRVMNKYGLLSHIRRRRKYRSMAGGTHRYDNLLNRQFNASAPNTKWVSDISYIKTDEGVLYLSIIRDLYDRSIVAYRTSTTQSIKLVLDTIETAMDKEKVTTELQLHSDQGFQYTSNAYFTLTRDYGIAPSMSRRGNCLDNAIAENFFGILKAECLNRFKLSTREQAQTLIDQYIYFYNQQRIQTKHGLTPYEFRRKTM